MPRFFLFTALVLVAGCTIESPHHVRDAGPPADWTGWPGPPELEDGGAPPPLQPGEITDGWIHQECDPRGRAHQVVLVTGSLAQTCGATAGFRRIVIDLPGALEEGMHTVLLGPGPEDAHARVCEGPCTTVVQGRVTLDLRERVDVTYDLILPSGRTLRGGHALRQVCDTCVRGSHPRSVGIDACVRDELEIAMDHSVRTCAYVPVSGITVRLDRATADRLRDGSAVGIGHGASARICASQGDCTEAAEGWVYFEELRQGEAARGEYALWESDGGFHEGDFVVSDWCQRGCP